MRKKFELINQYQKRFIDTFDDVLDQILPFQRVYQRLGAEEYLAYAQKKRTVFSLLLLLVNIFYFIFFIYLSVFLVAAFYVDKNNHIFFPTAISFVLLIYGFYCIFGHRIRGIWFVFFGIEIASSLFFIFDSLVKNAKICLLFTFLILCCIRCLDYHSEIAKSVLKSRLKNELEEEQLTRLLNYSPSFFSKEKKKNPPQK